MAYEAYLLSGLFQKILLLLGQVNKLNIKFSNISIDMKVISIFCSAENYERISEIGDYKFIVNLSLVLWPFFYATGEHIYLTSWIEEQMDRLGRKWDGRMSDETICGVHQREFL